jgi:hypothetical protein
MRCPGRPCTRAIPLRRCRRRRPASADRFDQRRRPCGFSPCECDAVRLDGGRGDCVRHFASRAARARRLKRGLCKPTTSSVSSARTGRGNRLGHARKITHHIKRHRFAHSPLDIGHAPSRCSGAVFRYRFEPSRPGWASGSFPQSRPAALLGFFVPFAGLLPQRVTGSFLTSRAHVPVRPIVRSRLIFVGRSAASVGSMNHASGGRISG